MVIIHPRINNSHHDLARGEKGRVCISRQPVDIRSGRSLSRAVWRLAGMKHLPRIVQRPLLRPKMLIVRHTEKLNRIIRLRILHQRRLVQHRKGFADAACRRHIRRVHIVQIPFRRRYRFGTFLRAAACNRHLLQCAQPLKRNGARALLRCPALLQNNNNRPNLFGLLLQLFRGRIPHGIQPHLSQT